jgi:hypothetical protein
VMRAVVCCAWAAPAWVWAQHAACEGGKRGSALLPALSYQARECSEAGPSVLAFVVLRASCGLSHAAAGMRVAWQ